MKLRVLLALLLGLGALAAAYAAGTSTAIRVNGLPLRAEAIVQKGVTYVPLRAVAEALDCRVSYDAKSGIEIWSNTPQLPGGGGLTLPGGVPNPVPVLPRVGPGVSVPRPEAGLPGAGR